MIKTETIIYGDSEQTFEGTLCFNDETSKQKPGVLVAPTIRGHTNFEVEKAVELAKLGYVGFAIDMYGKETRTEVPEANRAMMSELNADRTELLQRILLALKTLKNHPQVDKTRLGGIGFCFGGKCVLDLVRSGAEVKGIATFHGVYDKPPTKNDSLIKSSVLILHGWEDPLGTPSQLIELAEELTEKKAEWQILSFGNTGHSFTNPAANSPEQGLIYNEVSNKRAWLAMKNFFEELFTE